MCLTWEGVEARRRKRKKRRVENEKRIKAIGYSSNYRIMFINYVRRGVNFYIYVEFCTNTRLSPYSLLEWLSISKHK